MEIQVGKQSLAFAEAPYIISSASIVGKKEGEGPLGNRFDVVGEDDKFGQNTWEEAESTLQKEAFTLAVGKAGLKTEDIDVYKRQLWRRLYSTSASVWNCRR